MFQFDAAVTVGFSMQITTSLNSTASKSKRKPDSAP
jgi:hypothetical protein